MRTTARRGDWLQTYTGRQFWPLDPREDEVDIRDIAHALSCQGRFAGHTRAFYSVAQHSVLVSHHCGPADALWGLLHDASEAYLVDLPTPIKQQGSMASYRIAERQLMRIICLRFDIPVTEPATVRMADRRLLATEAAQLMGPRPAAWAPLPEPLPIEILELSPAQAEMAFLQRFDELTGTLTL